MINRGVVMLRPAAPFLEWAKSLDDSGLAPDPNDERTVYLVPEWEDDAGKERVLRAVFTELFEQELFGWHTDEADWPQMRGLREFRKWFDIEMHSMVVDVCGDALFDDEV